MKKAAVIALLILMSPLACGGSDEKGDAVPHGAKYYFSFLGDSRDGNEVLSLLERRSIYSGRPAFFVHLGDMISRPKRFEQWPAFITLHHTYFPHGTFYPVVGNHDVQDESTLSLFNAAFPEIPTVGYYAREIQDCFCIFLNSEDLEVAIGTIGPTQVQWLTDQLATPAAQAAKFRAVFVHRPVFPQNHHAGHPLLPGTLHDIFKNNNVDLVIAGHEHSFSRQVKDGVNYIISGGGGSPLFAAAGPKVAFFHYVQASYFETYINFRVIDLMGRVRDEFKVYID